MARQCVRFIRVALCATVLGLAAAAPAAADTYGFSCISNNLPGDCSILEAQLAVEVTAGAGNTVNFKFTNSGPAASSITDVHFNDLLPPLLSTPSVITYSSGVKFKGGCSPSSLPAGNTYNFTTTYCADSSSPTQPNGVNPGEWLNISYTLQGSYTFANVISAMNTGTYRVGVKVQGFATQGSETGITRIPPPQVPEPTSFSLLAGSGLVAMLTRFVRSRRKK